MSYMFKNATDFNQAINGGTWKTDKVTDYTNMFESATGMILNGAPSTPTIEYFKVNMPFCNEQVTEIKTDQGIFKVEDLNCSHTIEGLSAKTYLKTKNLINLINYRYSLFKTGNC